MSWNGSGTFTRIYSWVNDAAAAIDIDATRMDTDTNDIATNGFGNCLTRDGQGVPTANLPMANYIHTGVGNATARTNYPAVGQIQDGVLLWAAGGGTADAITATFSPAFTALVDGCIVGVRATTANATTTPTFSPNALTARTITKAGGQALVAGDIPRALYEMLLRYYATSTRWELLNPASGNLSNTVANGFTGAVTLASNGVLYGAGTSPILALAVNSTATKKYLQQVSSGAPSWAQIAAADLSDGTTGTGTLVLATTPTLVTPVLGTATFTKLNKVGWTAPTTAATLAFPTDNATITFQGTDTYVGRATTDTLTNKSISGSTNTITNVSLTTGVTGTLPTANGGTGLTSGNFLIAALEFVIDGGGVALTTGIKGYLEVPFACTINAATSLADQSGSCVVDIFKCTYSAFAPPTHPASGDKITASAPPTISSATKAQDTTLTGWTTSISAGDILGFNVNSATTITRVTISLKVTKT